MPRPTPPRTPRDTRFTSRQPARPAIGRTVMTALAGAMVLALGACGSGTPAETPPLQGAAIGGEFTLADKAGKTVRYSDFAGKYRVIYFGYTFCPDVCPLDLQNIMQGYHLFAREHADLAKKVQPIFITIDPARDTPQVIGRYAANFGPELMGLTGTDAQVAEAAKAFGAYYKKGEGTAPDAYLMNHTRAVYLMGPDGQPIALLSGDKDGRTVAAELARWVR